MKKLTVEQLHIIEEWEDFCEFHEMEFDEDVSWSHIWRTLGLEDEYENDVFEHCTPEEFHYYYLQWHDIVSSPLYKALSEN